MTMVLSRHIYWHPLIHTLELARYARISHVLWCQMIFIPESAFDK